MSKSTSALATPLREQLERLAAFEPSEIPVISLYLDVRADQHGRDYLVWELRGNRICVREEGTTGGPQGAALPGALLVQKTCWLP